MKWTIVYEAANARVWAHCEGDPGLSRHAPDWPDPAQLIRYARRIDRGPIFEFADDAERFRVLMLGDPSTAPPA